MDGEVLFLSLKANCKAPVTSLLEKKCKLGLWHPLITVTSTKGVMGNGLQKQREEGRADQMARGTAIVPGAKQGRGEL
jgi:hypothetical protein